MIQPLLQQPQRLKERLREIPDEPGCYLMRDGEDRILYIGKAKGLRQRVRSYFQASHGHSPRCEAWHNPEADPHSLRCRLDDPREKRQIYKHIAINKREWSSEDLDPQPRRRSSINRRALDERRHLYLLLPRRHERVPQHVLGSQPIIRNS